MFPSHDQGELELREDVVVIKFYFDHIQRMVKPGGRFYCVNRYTKGETKIKNYPFDNDWNILLSQSTAFQPHIHELHLLRMNQANPFPVSKALESLP